jgi:general secretion pathway protein G
MWLDYEPKKRRHWNAQNLTKGIPRVMLILSSVMIVVCLFRLVMPTRSISPYGKNLLIMLDDMHRLQTALTAFASDNGRYPTDSEGLNALVICPVGTPPGWNGPYISQIPVDPWGHPYIYRSPAKNGEDFDIYSCGSNGQDQGGDGENISWQHYRHH